MAEIRDLIDRAKFLEDAVARARPTVDVRLGGPEAQPNFELSGPQRWAIARQHLRQASEILGLPQWSNSNLAGQRIGKVAMSYEGFPRFEPFATHKVDLPHGFADRATDFAKANEAAGFASTPDGMVWHHVEDCRTLLLIPKEIHTAVAHYGGIAITKALDKKNQPSQEQLQARKEGKAKLIPLAGEQSDDQAQAPQSVERGGRTSVRDAARALGPGHTSSREQRTDREQSGQAQGSRPARPRSTTERKPDVRPGATPRSRG